MDRGLRILDCETRADLHGAVLLLLFEEGHCFHMDCSDTRIVAFVRGSVCLRFRVGRMKSDPPGPGRDWRVMADVLGRDATTPSGRGRVASLLGHGHHPWHVAGCDDPSCLVAAVLGS